MGERMHQLKEKKYFVWYEKGVIMKNWFKTSILIVLVIGIVLVSGCTGTQTNRPVTPTTAAPPWTQVKHSLSGDYVVVDITNGGHSRANYEAVVNFYQGDTKLNSKDAHFALADPGQTVRSKVLMPTNATRYELDGIFINTGDYLFKIEYTLI
ncbi:MAG: hypothetical protein NTY75_02740 [Candidatus Shapirobacteria bacterium]|nr:hypothetical protein [Candidatus Shapirobacteria bacterium]